MKRMPSEAVTDRKRQIIINADDFGASDGINRGITESHLRGVVTSASLMVNMPASEAAIDLIPDLPGLSVGLHVNFTNEGEALVVDLEDTESCRSELLAQYEAFRRLTGKQPTHLDSQHHVHTRSNLAPLFRDLARAARLPLRGNPPVKYVGSFYGQWDDQTHLEQISMESLTEIILGKADADVTEFGCHPGYVDDAFDTVYNAEREVELATLCDANLRLAIIEAGIEVIGFREVRPEMSDEFHTRAESSGGSL